MAEVKTVKQTLDKAKEILVLLPQNPGPDSIASALGLYLCLEKSGKQAYIACGTPLDFQEYPLLKNDRITQKIGNKNLVVSLKVDNRESIDKVSYNLDEETKTFNLIISPKKGANPLSSQAVSYSLSGAQADLIFIVGAANFNDLGSIYAAEPTLFNDAQTVAINRIEPQAFATYHINNSHASSIAEGMVTIIESLGLTFDADAATNLLASIDVVTDKLQLPSVSANTFDAVAKLIRAGGVRIMLQQKPVSGSVQNQSFSSNNQTPVTISPLENEALNADMPADEDVPHDWLEPKILKASKI